MNSFLRAGTRPALTGRFAYAKLIAASLLVVGAGVILARPGVADVSSLPSAREVSICTVVPQGAPCWASEQRLSEAYAAKAAALANPANCAAVQQAMNSFPPRTLEAYELSKTWITCRTEEVRAELEILRGPDMRPALSDNISGAAAARPGSGVPGPSPSQIGFVPLADGPSEELGPTKGPSQHGNIAQPVPRPDPYANYKSYDRESSEVDVVVRRPGEPWEMVQEGVEIGVLRLEDMLDIGDAKQQLQIANLQLDHQLLKREAEEREAARQAEQQRREAAERAEYQRQQNEYARQQAEYQREMESQRRREERDRRNQPGMLGTLAGALITGYAQSQGIPTPGSSYGGASNTRGPGSYAPSAPQTDYQRQACDQRIAAAANRLSGARLGSGICQSSRDAAALYAQIEQAYAGCEHYYQSDYQATVSARRQAEAAARASCAN